MGDHAISVSPGDVDALMTLQLASLRSGVLSVAVKLGIADIIAGAGQGSLLTAQEIAAQLPTSNPGVAALSRILRFLVAHKVFRAEYGDGPSEVRYGLTPISQLMVSRTVRSNVPILRCVLHPTFTAPFWYLQEAVLKEGSEPFRVANGGKDLWGVCKEDEEFGALFHGLMATLSNQILDAIIPEYQGFKDVGVVADVGGGVGASLRKIVQTNPHIKGINFDLPEVVAEAPDIPGVTHVGGDMFKSVPSADAIYMKWILHDWNDEESIQILKNCWKAVPEDGKVVLLEAVVPAVIGQGNEKPSRVLDADMLMLAHTNGKERTSAEWQAILSAAGWPRVEFISFPGDLSIIEGHKR